MGAIFDYITGPSLNKKCAFCVININRHYFNVLYGSYRPALAVFRPLTESVFIYNLWHVDHLHIIV